MRASGSLSSTGRRARGNPSSISTATTSPLPFPLSLAQKPFHAQAGHPPPGQQPLGLLEEQEDVPPDGGG